MYVKIQLYFENLKSKTFLQIYLHISSFYLKRKVYQNIQNSYRTRIQHSKVCFKKILSSEVFPPLYNIFSLEICYGIYFQQFLIPKLNLLTALLDSGRKTNFSNIRTEEHVKVSKRRRRRCRHNLTFDQTRLIRSFLVI